MGTSEARSDSHRRHTGLWQAMNEDVFISRLPSGNGKTGPDSDLPLELQTTAE